MTTKQKAQRRQARHDRLVAQRLEKKKALVVRAEVPADDEELDTEEGDELEDVSAVEEEVGQTEEATTEDEPEEVDLLPVRKDYGGDMPMAMGMPSYGAKSFAELDAAEAAAEQADEVRSASYSVSDLVHNIMCDPMMDPVAKSKAIQNVGSEFGDRVSQIIAGNAPEDGDGGDGGGDVSKGIDMDLLYTEAVLASDHRHMTWSDAMGDWLTKAKLSYAAKKAKGDSAFALVYTDKGGNKVRKYLIHDKAHVRNALARAAQQIKGGGAGAADARRALPKIHAAAKRMGIGMGKSNDAHAIILEKDAKGDWRWVGWASNNYIDWQTDIISKAAHEEYIQWLDQNPAMSPLFMTWHTPGTERTNPVDFWTFEKGFLILSGKLDEQEAAGLLKAQALTDLGLSIRGFGLREDKSDPRVVTKYRLFEVSDLPLENAANPFTGASTFMKEVSIMDREKYLAEIMGADRAKAFMEKTGMKQEQLDKAGVTQKEVEPVVEKPVAAPSADANAIVAQVLKELDVEGLNEFVLQAKEAMEKVPVLEGVIKEMQGNADQKLAEKIQPPASRFAWASEHRASTADETKIEKDADLAKRVPELGDNWLSQATNTRPIDVGELRS